MPENDDFDPDDDFFASAQVKRAPRTYPNVFRVLAGLATGLFIGGGIWGVAQVAYGINASDTTMVTPVMLQRAEANYYAEKGRFTSDLGQLKSNGGAFELPSGVNATIIGLCGDGWLAKVSGTLGSSVRYVSATSDSDALSVEAELADVKLPSCVTVDSLRKNGVSISVADSAVKISDLQVRRSKSVGESIAGVHEGARASWKADASCAAGAKAQYELTVQQEEPAGGVDSPGDDFDVRTYHTAKSAINLDDIYNGAKYTIKVYGSCSDQFSDVAAVGTTYTAALPAAPIRVLYDGSANVGGGVFPLVNASSSRFVTYDIQYRRAYATGWTTLVEGYDGDGVVRKDGYYPNYGDQFRARAVSVDGTQSGDWGPATTIRNSGY